VKYLKSFIACASITLITPTLAFAQEAGQPMSVYTCNQWMVRPWEGYQPGVSYGGGSGPAISENAAIEQWTSLIASEGFPREFFKVVCTYQGPYMTLNPYE
jgi:hypothetical protein